MAERFPIVLYGATGYTGKLIAKELERRGMRFAIAGRDPKKLAALRSELPSRPEVLVADVGDAGALEAMAAQGRVVLSCAGPFTDYGPPVQRAALKAGAHFLDITGEAAYMLESWRERDAEAKARGVAIVNAVGFDVVASDGPAWLASQGIGPVETLELSIFNKGRASQGTQRSALRGILGQSLGYEGGEWKEVPPGAFRRKIDFPSPVGTRWGASIPWGDVATAPRSTGARTVRIYFAMPLGAALAIGTFAPLGKTLRWKPVYERLKARIEAGPEGPTEAENARARFLVLAEATAVDGRRQRVAMSGPGGYPFTAVAASECAIRAAAPDFDKAGVLTPSQAFDMPSLLEALRPFGVEVQRLG